MQRLQSQGILRRWGAVLRHRQAGLCGQRYGGLEGEAERADEVGQIMAGFNEISHCYLREVPDKFGYSLFTMLHARSDEELEEMVAGIAEQTGLQDYVVIKSLKEFKKASMKYVEQA